VHPALVLTRDGAPFARDDSGGAWRVYRFVAGARSVQKIESTAQAREVARAFGAFQRRLVTLPAPRLHEVLPGFHDTRKRYAALHAAIAADPVRRAAAARDDIALPSRASTKPACCSTSTRPERCPNAWCTTTAS
jgi:hypothetical protein